MAYHKIKDVLKDSIADELGIEPGDTLISINGSEITDLIDYKFQIANENIELLIKKEDGEEYIYEIEKDYDDDLGLIFETGIIDKLKHCRNKCVFCFVDQLPKNVRHSLAFKDDDYRLSFLQGNFVTLTNVSDEEFSRIIRYKMSPIYLSVHATDDEIRKRMMRNPNAGGILDKIKELIKNGIEVHCQVVLCPGLNDGQILDKTIEDLSKLFPGVKSVAVVPVGLTDHREGLFELKTFDKEGAQDVLNKISKWQKRLKSDIKTSFVFAADEFYVLADVDIPDYNAYENFPQIENGVGLMAMFKKQFVDYYKKIGDVKSKDSFCVITGVSAYKFIEELVYMLDKKGVDIKVVPIINNFFGKKITVSGLITGSDIINQLKGKINGETLIIPDSMIKEGTDSFLDDVTIDDVEKELNTKVLVSEVDGKKFIQKIIGR
ncbi:MULTISPECIES: DUF512 domain-containing protein [unclassified Thermoanaerobacterium]|uniref:DUF512 domain-containing protein n=1 Tax=unclassified Thermoanaerobacterium TaxID=2622527 RepID=UPI000A164021|nr:MULTISPECIES: DUF512 domain-containing protein [unclassified Thermoanaerobacterium]MDE4542034.1 DUF512 domain-containing protein [Thermoanaerobacterium sp. R66]ORX24005.1 Fe-S oxidoreductase [Thermoanaerobacterium sp. PSU-2]